MRPWQKEFWELVEIVPDGCWLWRGFIAPDGYGRYGLRNQIQEIKAHRISWVLHYGPIPLGDSICHACDVKPCVNPNHLWLGSIADNNLDRARKGRSSTASRSLTEDEVRLIRNLYDTGAYSYRQLALHVHRNKSTIESLLTGRTYAKVI